MIVSLPKMLHNQSLTMKTRKEVAQLEEEVAEDDLLYKSNGRV